MVCALLAASFLLCFFLWYFLARRVQAFCLLRWIPLRGGWVGHRQWFRTRASKQPALGGRGELKRAISRCPVIVEQLSACCAYIRVFLVAPFVWTAAR